MKIANIFRVAIKALFSNKLRSLLTMLGIIIGVASVIAMLAIGQGSRQSIQDEISSMGSNMIMIQPGKEEFHGAQVSVDEAQILTMNDYQAVRDGCAFIKAVTPVVNGNGQVIYSTENWPTSIRGVNAEFLEIGKYSVENGSMFTDRDIKTVAKVCVIGQTVAENLFKNGEDPVGKTIRFSNIPFKVIGVLESKGNSGMGQDQDDIILAPYTTVQKRILAMTHLQSIIASATSEELADEAQEQIVSILRAQHEIRSGDDDDFTVRSQQELVDMFGSITQILTVLLAVIAGISLVIGGIGIMNIMYVSVTERTREIGLRMAVGGRNTDILLQFLIESVLISITGGLIGVGLGIGSTYLIHNILSWPVQVTSFSIILSFTVCSIIGIFFGWYPARKASGLDPINALRFE